MNVDTERERAVVAALRRLAQAAAEPAPNPEAETALLHAFDAAWARGATPAGFRSMILRRIGLSAAFAAAAIVLVVVRIWWTPAAPSVSVIDPNQDIGRIPANPPGSGDVRILGAAPPPNPIASVGEGRNDRSIAPGRRRLIARRRPAMAIAEPSDFVPWPGSAGLPPLESGAFVRIDLPASLLPSLGVLPPAHPGVVQADILVGQDGFARAIRLVPITQQQE